MLKISVSKEPLTYDEFGRPWYDTKEGVARGISSLASFNILIHARHEAAYEKGEKLNEFTVLGRYRLDTCGNCCLIEQQNSTDIFLGAPNILTTPEFYSYFKDKKFRLGLNLDGMRLVPPEKLKCAYCGETWNIENCHDAIVWTSDETLSLVDFVGQKLAEFKAIYQENSGGIYHFSRNTILVRNDKNIDLSLKYPNPKKIWERDIVKNEHGYIGEDEGLDDDYVIQEGDECHFSVSKFFHHECNRLNLSENYEKYYRDIFIKAGFTVTEIKAQLNEYCSCDRCSPWFLVTTTLGVIKIGWRKRVINIDFSAITGDVASLFKTENVTKGKDFIHAWGTEKAQEYLNKICKHLENK